MVMRREPYFTSVPVPGQESKMQGRFKQILKSLNPRFLFFLWGFSFFRETVEPVELPVLAGKAITFIMPFATTYKCEAGFSTLVFLKR